MPRGSRLVSQLDRALMERQVAEGFTLLDRSNSDLARLQPSQQDGASILVRVAQWVDLGYRDVEFLQHLLLRFPTEARGGMTLKSYLQLLMAEAFCALGEENLDRAIELLDYVSRAEYELGDQRLAAIAHFWKGRAHRKKGEYDAAMVHVVKGRTLMQAIPAPKLAAVIQIQESWLLFQKGQLGDALRLLEEARVQLLDTDDVLSLGNIESAQGRMERHAGKYAEALDHFAKAVQLYARRDPNHRNLARALVNTASVKRLIALQLRKRIDAQAESSKTGRRDASRGAPGQLARYTEICREALGELQRAGEIYTLHHYYGGIASVLVSTGYLHLDSGNIELGATEALKAYELAHDKNDHIHMARARTLQCITENSRVDEQLGEDADAVVYANNARMYSEDAVRWAELTQNRRLAAEAYVARGMMFANDLFQEWDQAKGCMDQAAKLLGPEVRDHL